ncbi:unnamed protein product [Auanema sp. JU1783]|nr:unnamed protein product [Auanema sp. JU1783]
MNGGNIVSVISDCGGIEQLNYRKIHDVAMSAFFESEYAGNNTMRSELLKQGIQLGHSCYKLNPTLNCSRNIALCSLNLAELKKDLDQKLRHLETAMNFFQKSVIHLHENPTDTQHFDLLHLKGRLALTISTLPIEAHFEHIFSKHAFKLSLEDAVKCFEKAEEIKSGDLENQFYLAHCYELLKDYDSALMWFYEVTTSAALTETGKRLKAKALNKLPEDWKQ